MKLSIWFIYPIANGIRKIPSLQALIEYLSEGGHSLTVFYGRPSDDDRSSGLSEQIASLVPLPCGENGFRRLLFEFPRWCNILLAEGRRCRPDVIMAVDNWGLLLAQGIFGAKRSRIIYLPMELRIPSEATTLSRKILFYLEASLHRKSFASILHDEWREACVRIEHKLAEGHKILHLPNSPKGGASFSRSDSFRNQFRIPDDACVLLYIGSLCEHFLVHDLVRFAGRLGQNRYLIVHSPLSFAQSIAETSYVKDVELLARSQNNVVLSRSTLSNDELTELIRCSDIGVGLFRPVVGNYLNEVNMGHSSGKLALYLQNGRPIISCRYPSTRWIDDSGAGVTISSVNEQSLRHAVAYIAEDYEARSRDAVRYFNDTLALKKYLAAIANTITHSL